MPVSPGPQLQSFVRELFQLSKVVIPETLDNESRTSKKELAKDIVIALRCAIELLTDRKKKSWRQWFRDTLQSVSDLDDFEAVIEEFRRFTEDKEWRDKLKNSDPFSYLSKEGLSLEMRKKVSASLPQLQNFVPGDRSTEASQSSTKTMIADPTLWNICEASPVETENIPVTQIQPAVSLLEKTPENKGRCRFPITMGPRKGKACLLKAIKGEGRCILHIKHEIAGEEGYLRSTRFRVHATIHMQKLLAKWFGACRALYNKCVDADPNLSAIYDNLKDELVTGTQPETWMNKCPNALRSEVIRDYCEGRDGAKVLTKKKLDKYQRDLKKWRDGGKRGKKPVIPKMPKMKHRTKKDVRSVLRIPKGSVDRVADGFKLKFEVIKKECDDSVRMSKRRIHSEILYLNSRAKRKDKRFQELLEKNLKHDVRLIRYRDGRLFMEVPMNIAPKNVQTTKVAVGIDPGLRTPFVAAGTDGTIFEMGARFRANVNKHRERKGELQKKLGDLRGPKRKARTKRIRKRMGRLDSKIINTRTQFHYEAIKELSPYQHVYLPKINYAAWNRGLNKTSRRTCQEVAHPLFRNRLINKSEILGSGRVVHNCSEYMTTQTCSSCFRIHDKIGPSEVFDCPHCRVVVGRDHNAARNILLTNLRP